MRECMRCGAQMVDGGCLMNDADVRETTVSVNRKKPLRSSIGNPTVAVCPHCGEVSLYIPDIGKQREKIEKFRGDLR
ncbi:MAG: nucleic acid-binding protein [Clostridiales bacterium]|nr:nucleic acid-binding protein [Clostridiales bacterium]